MKKIIAILALLVVSFQANDARAEKLRALFGDGSVRYASSGPFALSTSHNALIGLLLPAVQKARASVMIVDNTGKVLKTKLVDIPTNQIPTNGETGFWQLSLTLSVSDNGEIAITDGTTPETIGSLTTSEHVSVLIGLLLPAVQKVRDAAARMHTGSLQLINKRTGELNFILPFIEQSVLAKNVSLTSR